MAVTKVSSAVHFLSRAAGVRGREGAVSGHWVPNTDVYVTDTGLVVKVELVMEISYGPFESVLELPAGYDLSQAKAAYVNGFLRIDVPLARQPLSKTTKVPIAEGN